MADVFHAAASKPRRLGKRGAAAVVRAGREASHPAIKRAKPEFNESEREKVRDILKGMKVI